MADQFRIPPGKGLPLVDLETDLLPEPTMQALDARYSGAGIDDDETSTTKVWSSSKTDEEIEAVRAESVSSPTITRIVVSEDPNEPLENGDLLVVVPTGTLNPDITPPTTPTNLSATPTGSTTVDLMWDASTDAIGVTGYQYRMDGGTPVAAGTGTSASVTGLTPSTSYTFEVRAYDAAGNYSAWSAPDSATTNAGVDVTAPSTPTGLVATPISATSVGLTWNASTDNVGVTGYEYRIDGGSPVDAGSGTSETVNGLTGSTTYTFEVRAYDAAGNRSAWSAPDDATTDAVPSSSVTTTFASDTAETPPTGWTSRWGAGTATVKADAGANGGKVLRLTAPSGTRSAWSWDSIAATADAEILFRWKGITAAAAASAGGGRALIRGAGSVGAETALHGFLPSSGAVSASKYVGGTAATAVTGTNIGAPGNGLWHRTRMRAVGGTLYVRTWEEPSAEPATWDATFTNTADILGAGWVGLMAFNNGTTDIDWVSVTVNGDTAEAVS